MARRRTRETAILAYYGVTVENRPCAYAEHYDLQSTDDDAGPERVAGWYESDDGGGHFDVTARAAMPWVVHDGQQSVIAITHRVAIE